MIDSFGNIDRLLFITINSFNFSWLNPVMIFISGQVIWLPFIALALWQSRTLQDSRKIGIFILFMFLAVIASDVTSSYVIKNIFGRLRPCRVPDLKLLINFFGQKCGGKYTFVSSHAANSMCLVSFSLLALKPKFKYAQLVWLVPVVAGWSRIYLGVHYPGDILGGLVIGIFWGYLFSKFFQNTATEQAAVASMTHHL